MNGKIGCNTDRACASLKDVQLEISSYSFENSISATPRNQKNYGISEQNDTISTGVDSTIESNISKDNSS